MGVDDAGDRDPAARELLDDHRVGGQVEAHAAVLLGDRHPEEAELLHLLDDRLGELVLVVVLLGVGDDLVVDELPDHLDDGLLLVGHLLIGALCCSVATAMAPLKSWFEALPRLGKDSEGALVSAPGVDDDARAAAQPR